MQNARKNKDMKTQVDVVAKKFVRQEEKPIVKSHGVVEIKGKAKTKEVKPNAKGKPESKAKPAINPSLAYCPKQFGKVLDHGNFICIEGFKKGITKENLLKTLNTEVPPEPSEEFLVQKPSKDAIAKEKARINSNRLYKAIWRLKQIGVIVNVKNGVYKI